MSKNGKICGNQVLTKLNLFFVITLSITDQNTWKFHKLWALVW